MTQEQCLLHGGVVTAIADVTCGYTALTMMPEGYKILTVEGKTNLLRPVTSEQIVSTGSVVKAGSASVSKTASNQARSLPAVLAFGLVACILCGVGAGLRGDIDILLNPLADYCGLEYEDVSLCIA